MPLQWAKFGSMALPHLVFVLVSLSADTIKGHADAMIATWDHIHIQR